MARIRSLKIGFFTNEDLCSLSTWHRLLFAGLWLLADREGRLEDRPKRVKAAIFPYDSIKVGRLIDDLVATGFVIRYGVCGQSYLMIPNFSRHQLISRDEPASEIPAPDGTLTAWERPPNDTVRARVYQRDHYHCVYCGRDMTITVRARCVDHVIPYSRGGSHRESNLATACKPCNQKKWSKTPTEAGLPWPDGLGAYMEGAEPTVNVPVNPPLTGGQPPPGQELGIGNRELGNGNGTVPITAPAALTVVSAGDRAQLVRNRFERWWTEYPRKVGKDAAWREWLKRSPSDDLTDRMIATLHEQRASAQWLRDGGQFIPHPRTYLHQGRWEDEPEPPPTALERAGVLRPALPPRTQTNLASAAAFMANHAGKDRPS